MKIANVSLLLVDHPSMHGLHALLHYIITPCVGSRGRVIRVCVCVCVCVCGHNIECEPTRHFHGLL